MNWQPLRPTFSISIQPPRQTAIERLRALHASSSDTRFLMHGEYGELHLPPGSHRLWSPHLSFYVTELDGETVVLGRFAPRIEVWTAVWIVYLMLAFTAFFGLTFAFSQWMLRQFPWSAVIALAAMAMIAALYGVAYVGQQWSADQMRLLRERLESILAEAELVAGMPGPADQIRSR